MNGWIMPNIGTVWYTPPPSPTRFIVLLYVHAFLLKREWRPCVKPFTASVLNLLFCNWFVFLLCCENIHQLFRLEERSLFRRLLIIARGNSFVMCVHPQRTARLKLDEFSWNFILAFVTKFRRED